MIPKIIWQTYKVPYSDLPGYARKAAESWQSRNPGWQYKYMSDEQVIDFVASEYGQDWVDLFKACPVGVMRADMWRYMVVHRHGGMYADLDTICKQPIDEWLDPTARMVVCPENEIHFCQWAFAASAESPVLASVLGLIQEGFKAPDYSDPDFVHKLTGPAVWTRGIRQALNIRSADLIKSTTSINESSEAREAGFFCHPNWRWFHWHACEHIYGSQKWNDGRYVQWIEERKKVSRGTRRM